MNKFTYLHAEDVDTAVDTLASNSKARCIAGGTNLLDLMKVNVMNPDELIDINHLSFNNIEEHNGGLRLGATATNADTAYHPLVMQLIHYWPGRSWQVLRNSCAIWQRMEAT